MASTGETHSVESENPVAFTGVHGKDHPSAQDTLYSHLMVLAKRRQCASPIEHPLYLFTDTSVLQMASTSSGSVCYHVQQQTSKVCIPSPRSECIVIGCSKPILGEPGTAFSPVGNSFILSLEITQHFDVD